MKYFVKILIIGGLTWCEAPYLNNIYFDALLIVYALLIWFLIDLMASVKNIEINI